MIIDISDDQLQRANQALRGFPGAFPRAVASTTNRVIEGMRTDAVRETVKRYHVRASDVRKTLTLKKASAGNLEGTMISSGPRRSLADYKLTGGNGNLQGAVKKDGMKALKNAFLVKRGERKLPYIRTGSGRYALEILISPSIPQIVKNEETIAAMEKGAAVRFRKTLDHNILRLMGAFK